MESEPSGGLGAPDTPLFDSRPRLEGGGIFRMFYLRLGHGLSLFTTSLRPLTFRDDNRTTKEFKSVKIPKMIKTPKFSIFSEVFPKFSLLFDMNPTLMKQPQSIPKIRRLGVPKRSHSPPNLRRSPQLRPFETPPKAGEASPAASQRAPSGKLEVKRDVRFDL